MYANNEIGTIQPVREIGAVCRKHGVPFHTDAVQAVGPLAIDVRADNIDLLSASAHKFHGPKGVGFLYARKGLPLRPLISGGAQESGKRAGTENLPGIAGMAEALKMSLRGARGRQERIDLSRDYIRRFQGTDVAAQVAKLYEK
jgi:cysteine desulfurase